VNAAGQRTLSTWLGGACVLAAVALCVLVAGVGRGIAWGEIPPPRELGHARVVATPPPEPLARFAEVWQRPLFAADRKPAMVVTGDAAVSLGDLQLTGIILTPGLRMALLQNAAGDQSVRVREGAAMPDGRWTLATLSPRSAIFDNGGERKELTLATAAPAALERKPGGPPAPGNGPVMQRPNAPMPESSRPASPSFGDEAAQRKARIEALKAAVEKRRAEQAAPSANEGVR
jgi:general secretion pathway protein N